MRFPLRKLIIGALIPIVAGGLLAAGLGAVKLRNTLAREVVPGIYRTGQPTPERLRSFKEELKVTTVVNLRGKKPEAEWYLSEKEACDTYGIELVDIHFRTFKPPPRIETLQLIETLDRIKGPTILHCEAGSDRTGWASGIAKILEGESVQEARKELSAFHGHFCDEHSCDYHAFFDQYGRWLRSESAEHSVELFRQWVNNEYAPGKYNARVRADETPGRIAVEPGGPISILVHFENRSEEEWIDEGSPKSGVRPAARLLGPYDQRPPNILELFRMPHSSARDVFRDADSRVIEPGEEFESVIAFAAPQEAGLYVLQIDLVDEMVAWFSDFGGPGALVEIHVSNEHGEAPAS